MKAFETTAIVENRDLLKLDRPVNLKNNKKVKVIILVNEGNDIEEKLWLKAVKNNPTFDFLKDTKEDIYSLQDGNPFNDKK